VEFENLIGNQFGQGKKRLPPETRKALVRFAENFYRNVYPPELEKQGRAFDFGDPKFLEDYMRESRNIWRSKGVLSDYIFMARAELGLYHTLHRLRARVHTSEIVRKYL
jgi:hypothetical protein